MACVSVATEYMESKADFFQFHSGQHTYSEIPRVTVIFRIFGLITLVGLGLTIAGGILGSPVSPNTGNAGWILRRAGACVYAAVYLLLILAFFGTFSYRWHLRSYRRNVSIQPIMCPFFLPFSSFDTFISASLGNRHRPSLPWCAHRIRHPGCMVLPLHLWCTALKRPSPLQNEPSHRRLDILPCSR